MKGIRGQRSYGRGKQHMSTFFPPSPILFLSDVFLELVSVSVLLTWGTYMV